MQATLTEQMNRVFRERYGKNPGDRWVTIGATNGEGGTPVKIDGSGNITSGPKGIKGKSLSALDRDVAGTAANDRQKTIEDSVGEAVSAAMKKQKRSAKLTITKANAELQKLGHRIVRPLPYDLSTKTARYEVEAPGGGKVVMTADDIKGLVRRERHSRLAAAFNRAIYARRVARDVYRRLSQPERYEKGFVEQKHPRDDDGKFTSGGSSGKSLSPARRIPGSGDFRMKDGAKLPDHMAKYKIPPAWTDVKISEDPDAAVVAAGYDAKGRRQTIYSDAHHMRQAAAKFARISELMRKADAIRNQNQGNLSSDDEGVREAAAVMELIYSTGIRPGSDRDTKSEKQAYGATTLRAEHVVQDKDGSVRLKFTGKKGVDLDIPISEPSVAKMLVERKKRGGRLFATDDKKLRDYVHTLNGGSFKPKDFRTLRGTSLAIREIQRIGGTPKDQKDYQKKVRQVADVVSKALGNTPVVALQSYIDPTVFSQWRPAA